MTSPAEELKKSRTDLISLLSGGEVSDAFPDTYTEVVDHYFRRSLQESRSGQRLFREKKPFALVAVGGYGRRDLCLHSDIDVIILFNSKIPSSAKELAEDIFYPLWDAGLDLGHGIRSVKDCLALCKDDFEVLTSMMDARFICGDSPLYLSLLHTLRKKVVSKRANAFSRWLEEQDQVRKVVFGDASYLLEPDLKEGIGGLRDYHHMLWLAKAFFDLTVPRDLEYMGKLSHNEYQELKANLGLVSLVRNHLHRICGRKRDRLTFEYQEEIARILGFRHEGRHLAVEQFLGRLHTAMASIKSLRRSFVLAHLSKKQARNRDLPPEALPEKFQLSKGEIGFASPEAILSDPFLLMEIFELSGRLGSPLSLEAKRLIRDFLHLVDETFIGSQRAIKGFLRIMDSEKAFETLDQMLEVGFLGAFIPEFGAIIDRVQFGDYHIFPVGRHALQTLANIKDLPRQKDILLLDIFADIYNPEPLFLSCLFHDIGKVGPNHARKGALLARGILRRFSYDTQATEDVLFLIKHHLLLAETATRRDLDDEKVIVQCARAIGTMERLKMLYLLAWADAQATGPRAWNEWTTKLLQELFLKILHTLDRGELATPDASRKARQTLLRVRRESAGLWEPEELEALLEAMTPRYLLGTRPADIVRHLGMFRGIQEGQSDDPSKAFILDAKEDLSAGTWEVTILTKDRPGLFSDIAGVLALNNINILSARIYTWRNGTAVDLFSVTRPVDPIHSEEAWQKVRLDLGKTLEKRPSLAERLEQKATSSMWNRPKRPAKPPEIRVDNESSDFFTVIEAFADDRMGLLYLITRTLFNLGLDIGIAKIATKGNQIADVFYVRDIDGQKVVDAGQIKGIKETLLRALQQG
ncbi:MAG: [protein-PII] uridylyltransferase [Desulfobacterales bacterium]|nr:[protein-PII] uridylyltransferase [Desulfobacterales bacterium]